MMQSDQWQPFFTERRRMKVAVSKQGNHEKDRTGFHDTYANLFQETKGPFFQCRACSLQWFHQCRFMVAGVANVPSFFFFGWLFLWSGR